MDPVDLSTPYRAEIMEIIKNAIKPIDGVVSMHDLRLVTGPTHTNVIFDIVIAPGCKSSEDEIKKVIDDAIHKKYPNFFTAIDFDKSYINI